MAYTTTDFLNSVRQRGSIPTSSNTANVNNTTNLLNLATEELHIKLLPLIMSVRSEFYVRKKDYTITINQSTYKIPTRASGMVVRDIQIINGTDVKSLPEMPPEEATTTATGTPEAYYFEDESVVLYPTPSATTGTLRMKYFIRPSRLAATTDCAQISAINTATLTVTVSAIPSSWTAGLTMDFVSADAPHKCRDIDITSSAIVGTAITLASLPTDLAVGDWVALSDYSPIPQVPFEFQPVLAQMTTLKALEANGDQQGAATAEKDLNVLRTNALALVTPRNQGEPKRVIPQRWR